MQLISLHPIFLLVIQDSAFEDFFVREENGMDYEFIYRYLAETLYQALTEDAFYITLEKSVAEGSAREAMIRYMDYSMVEAAQYGKLLISSDRKSGAAIWSRPLPRVRPTMAPRARMSQWGAPSPAKAGTT